MNNLGPRQISWGISLGSMHWATQALSRDRKEAQIARHSTERNVPPAVLLNRTSGEPIRLDYWSPPHPQGTADPWPPEATVSPRTGCGRFPIAAAWTGRNTGQSGEYDNRMWPWKIEGDIREISSLDAISKGAAQLAKIHAKNATSAIVIPNDFRQREQQAVLDSCSTEGVNASLVWLPVAAALAWLEENQTKLSQPTSRSDNPLRLPVVHSDWGQIRCSTIDLIPWNESGSYRWIPARKRPVISDWFCPGFGWNEAAQCGTTDLQTMWNRLFAKPSRKINSGSDESGRNVLEQVADWLVPQWTHKQVDEALAKHLEVIENPVSLIFVGDFAARVFGGSHVRQLTHNQPLWQLPTSIYDGVDGESFLAKGAAIFARDRSEGRTSYLDTLPNLELFVDRNHQYAWLTLLGEEDQFVAGGQEWKLPNPIDTLALRRGATGVKLVVAHEEHPGVRELQVLLDRPAEQRLSAELHVSAVPAQGNARLRLVTESLEDIPERSILANWDRMQKVLDEKGLPVSKEAFLKMQPRAFPELFPRRSSYAKWLAAMPTIKSFIQSMAKDSRGIAVQDSWSVSSVKDRLMAKDQAQSPIDATAIGSDFKAPFDQSTLESLGDSLLKLWKQSKHVDSPILTTAIRALGYISIDDNDFDNWLAENLNNGLRDRQAVLHTAGLALRSPKNIATLFDFIFFRNSRLASPGANDLKAISQVLRYRADATREIESKKCEQVIECCLGIFEHGMESGGGGYPFRWSSLVIVYMLRRRMFDVDFLDPEQQLAVRAKQSFRTAIERYKQRRLRPLGGSVDLPAALRQMIDYIDRKGAGDILMANDE